MQIIFRPPDDIKPYDKDPRHNDAAVDSVARSIREFGFRQPIVVDDQGVIVVGHTRWKAARKLGMELVPVHVAEGLTPEQARACRIADKQTASIATWDLSCSRSRSPSCVTPGWTSPSSASRASGLATP